MTSSRLILIIPIFIFTIAVAAQPVTFNFESAPIHSSLPIDLNEGGISAHFSATGQGFSIQPANTMGFTPLGFSGLCIYPNSIYIADLLVSFTPPLTSFSILYAPQELGCDDSATLRVTAYSGGAFVATATATAASPGTWPSETLAIATAVPFDSVVVHYDARPPTCQDWGPIFMADNMTVTPTAGGGLPGDCDGNGTVSIGEVQKAINMFLGTLAPGCGVDCSGDGTVSIGEVQKVINAFLGVSGSC
jgi:hypothetical protein